MSLAECFDGRQGTLRVASSYSFRILTIPIFIRILSLVQKIFQMMMKGPSEMVIGDW